MLAIAAAARLEALLLDRGVVVTNGVGRGEDARVVWEMFCAMALEPVDTPFRRNGVELLVPDDHDADLLLFEAGPYEMTEPGGTVYGLSFSRQFTFEDRQGYAGMYAVAASIVFCGDTAGDRAETQLWGYAGPARALVSDRSHPEISNWAGHVHSWAQRVEAMTAFRAFHELRPLGFAIGASDI